MMRIEPLSLEERGRGSTEVPMKITRDAKEKRFIGKVLM